MVPASDGSQVDSESDDVADQSDSDWEMQDKSEASGGESESDEVSLMLSKMMMILRVLPCPTLACMRSLSWSSSG